MEFQKSKRDCVNEGDDRSFEKEPDIGSAQHIFILQTHYKSKVKNPGGAI